MKDFGWCRAAEACRVRRPGITQPAPLGDLGGVQALLTQVRPTIATSKRRALLQVSGRSPENRECSTLPNLKSQDEGLDGARRER
jgi:hypothetical protein